MRKYTPKLLLAAAFLLLTVCLCACGQSKSSPYAGIYRSMKVELDGYALTGADAAGASITLENGGICKVELNGETGNGKWSVTDGSIAIEAEGVRMVGKITENTILFDDFLDGGVLVIFGKEGTEAVNVSFYFSETEKNMVGTWQSVSVTNIFDEDASNETAPDGMTLEIRDDKTVIVTRNGVTFDPQVWTLFDGEVFLDIDISWAVTDEGLIVDYYIGDDWYTYTCVKK